MAGNGVSGVAKTTIEALKGSPMMLALVILNVLVLGVVFYAEHLQGQRAAALVELVLTRCLPESPRP